MTTSFFRKSFLSPHVIDVVNFVDFIDAVQLKPADPLKGQQISFSCSCLEYKLVFRDIDLQSAVFRLKLRLGLNGVI